MDKNNIRIMTKAFERGCVPYFLLITTLLSAAAPNESQARVTLQGKVIDTQSQGLASVRVSIATAAPKQGKGFLCPSCYVDCGKMTLTDADGNFEIPNLDPELRFEILAVANGYVSTFERSIDPAEDKPEITMQGFAPSQTPADQLFQGRVVDSSGDPIADVIVEIDGWTIGDTTTWGRARPIMKTPIAVTDAEGQFTLATLRKVAALHINLSSSTHAQQEHYDLPLGGPETSFELHEGVSISGRLTDQGKPLADRTIGIVSQKRTPRSNFTRSSVPTNSQGEFHFFNLPADLSYYLAATIESVSDIGQTPIKRLGPWKNGHSENIGDLEIETALSISGVVKTKNGEAIPPDSVILIAHQRAWDSLSIPLAADGRFNFKNVLPGPITVRVRVPGFRLAAMNRSFSVLNGGELLATLSQSAENLLFLIEEGSWQSDLRRPNFPSGENARDRPLHGIEALPKTQQAAKVMIQVRDKSSKAPITHFRLTPGWKFPGGSEPVWDSYQQQEFEEQSGHPIVIAKRGAAAFVRIEADGYIPTHQEVEGQHDKSLVIYLQPGNGYHGKVLTPDGSPAIGAQVLLTKHWPNNERHSLVFLREGQFRYDSLNQHEVAFADLSGRFQLPPKARSHPIIITHPKGYAAIEKPNLTSAATIQLQAWGTIEGVITGGPADDLDLAINRLSPREQVEKERSLLDRFLIQVGLIEQRERTDFWDFILVEPRITRHSDGTFVIETIPPGRWNIQLTRKEPDGDGWIGKRVRSTIADVGPGQTAMIELAED